MLNKIWLLALLCLQPLSGLALEKDSLDAAMQAKGLRQSSEFTGMAAIAQNGQLVWHFAGTSHVIASSFRRAAERHSAHDVRQLHAGVAK